MNRRLILATLLAVVLVGSIPATAQDDSSSYMVLVSATQINYEGTPAWEYWYDIYANGWGSASQIRIGGFDANLLLNPLNQRWDSSAADGWGEQAWGEFPSIGDGDPEGTDQWVLTANVGAMLNPLHSPSEYLGLSAMMYAPTIDGDDELRYWYASIDQYKTGLWMTIRLVHPDAPGEINYSLITWQWDKWRVPIIGPAPSAEVSGDLDADGDIDADDIDLMGDYIRTGIAPTVQNYDLSDDGVTGGTDGAIDINDLDYLVRYLVETSAVDGDGNPIFGTQYGDFNLDGEIELGDLTRLGTYYGVGDTWAEGNANPHLDELIELGDLTILGTYYGASNGGVDAIPEPMTMSLLAVGAAALIRRRRRA